MTSRPDTGRVASGGGRNLPGGEPTAGRAMILHVVESLGSGVATALEDYVRNTPEFVHVVLGWRRAGAQTGDDLGRLAADVLPLPSGRLAQLRAVRRRTEELRPDIIHAHSSYAGLYVRLLPRRLAPAVVYTPHGFSFERRDVPAALRGAYWLTEAALSLRGACVAAVGPREADLARRLPGRNEVVHVPHVIRPAEPVGSGGPVEDAAAGTGRGAGLCLVTIGRIAPQKDPGYFRRLVLLGRDLDLPLRWIWVGGGEPAEERALREAGVLVTGWLPRARALGWLAAADLYVHTAAWEGVPISVLEAVAHGLPVVARRNHALAPLDLPVVCDTPDELIEAIRTLQDDRRRARLRADCARLLEQHRPESQREALRSVYRAALRAGALPARPVTPGG